METPEEANLQDDVEIELKDGKFMRDDWPSPVVRRYMVRDCLVRTVDVDYNADNTDDGEPTDFYLTFDDEVEEDWYKTFWTRESLLHEDRADALKIALNDIRHQLGELENLYDIYEEQLESKENHGPI